jgi:putative ABC transport system permease protein
MTMDTHPIRRELQFGQQRTIYMVVGVAKDIRMYQPIMGFPDGMVNGISTANPATFRGAAAGLTFMTLAACYLPACRASRVDPPAALRYE